MHKLLHRPTSSLPIPILSSSSLISNSTPLLFNLPPKSFHSLTMANPAITSSSGVSFPLPKSLPSSSRYSNASYVRTCFCPTLTLTRHTTTTTSNNPPWLLLKHSQHSNATSQSSFHNNPEQNDHVVSTTTEDDSSSSSASSSTNTTSSFKLNRRQKSSSSTESSSSSPDLLAIPGVGPRNFRKLVQKGIQGVAQLKQLYKDKVVVLLSVSKIHALLSSVLGFFLIYISLACYVTFRVCNLCYQFLILTSRINLHFGP